MVVIQVRECSPQGPVRSAEAWYGGFDIEADASDMAEDVVKRIVDVCNAQLAFLVEQSEPATLTSKDDSTSQTEVTGNDAPVPSASTESELEPSTLALEQTSPKPGPKTGSDAAALVSSEEPSSSAEMIPSANSELNIKEDTHLPKQQEAGAGAPVMTEGTPSDAENSAALTASSQEPNQTHSPVPVPPQEQSPKEGEGQLKVAQRARSLFPNRFPQGALREDAVVQGKTSSKGPQLEAGAVVLWWVKKPIERGKPLSARCGKNNKTKIKVILSPGPEQVDDASLSEAGVLAGKRLATFLEILRKEPSGKQKLDDSTQRHPDASQGSPKRAKREPVDLSFVLGPKHQNDDYEWRVPQTRLEKLSADPVIQAQLGDQRLLNILVDIERAPNRLDALEKTLESNSTFAEFVDVLLETIGATQKLSMPDGTTQVQSCITEIVERQRPSFLADAKTNL